jgi:hypothetical protein
VRSLASPKVDVGDVLDLSGTSGRIASVHPYRGTLLASEVDYRQAMATPDVHVVPLAIDGISTSVHATIKWAYKTKIVDGSARDVYELLQSASGGRCPNCLVRDSQQLDHYLPKETYPGLALHPANLVPICSWCNHRKRQKVASTLDDQFLHPYFDDLGPFTWLAAEVVEEPLAPLRYSVRSSPAWSETMSNRVKNHFERYDLAHLFAGEAATLLASISYRLSRSSQSDREALLLEEADSYWRGERQPWLAAAYEAWGNNEWFCAGGWLSGPEAKSDLE